MILMAKEIEIWMYIQPWAVDTLSDGPALLETRANTDRYIFFTSILEWNVQGLLSFVHYHQIQMDFC